AGRADAGHLGQNRRSSMELCPSFPAQRAQKRLRMTPRREQSCISLAEIPVGMRTIKRGKAPSPPGTIPMNERDIFHAALEIADPAERSAYLESACAGDAALKRHIEGLLAMPGQLGNFLELPATGLNATAACPSESPGTAIGPYKLIEQIGEGGMGTVWMA